MRFKIKHEIEGRMRVHFLGSTMTYRQADTLLYYLENKSEVISAKVYERTGDAVIRYKGGAT